MENTTGTDLSSARYHDDRNSHHINAALGAKAATHRDHIFLGAGQSPHNVQLMAHELTHTVQQGAPQVQRWFGKKKPKKPTTNKDMFDAGTAATNTYLTVSAAVKTGTKTRGTKSLQSILAGGSGHSWLEIRLGPAYPDLAAMTADANGATIVNAMEDSTRTELSQASRRTTIGFYPDIGPGAITPKTIAKQMFMNLPGHIREPEQAHFVGSERASQGFPVTDVATALDLLAYIRANRSRPYNIYRYNCTDFVNGAMERIGYSMGKISGSFGITMPTLLYKNIYSRAELGDRSAKFTHLEAKTNAKGKQYDLKHLPKKAQKKLDKKKNAAAPMLREREKRELWSRAIATYTAPYFLGLQKGGMTRPNETIFGVTGVVLEHGWGEIIIDNRLDAIELKQFEEAFGFPYPVKNTSTTGTNADALADDPATVAPTDTNAPGNMPSPTMQEDQPLKNDEPIPQQMIEGFNDIEMDELDNVDEQEIQILGF